MPADDTTRVTPVAADPSTVTRGPLAPASTVIPAGAADGPTRTHDPEQTASSPPVDFRAADVPPTADPPLTPFAQFEPIDELGRGGMGVVYRALDTDFMRHVAVKVLSERLVGNRTAVRRFLEEARVTGQLTHNTIPPVHQVLTLPDGRPVLVMKLIKGRTLADMLKDRPDPSADLPRFLDILEKVCEGAGFAHSRRVIHRDLKPGNIMVGAFGEVQVMDWGLAKEVRKGAGVGRAEAEDPPAEEPTDRPAADHTVMRDVRFADEEYTRAGTILGTPAYMSPEQAAADPAAIDQRADVFGLGAILCTILTGHPPYQAKSVTNVVLMALNWDIADAFRRLNQNPSRAGGGLIDLCRRCLARDPARRPTDGEAVAKELAELRAAAASDLQKTEMLRMAEIAKGQELKRRMRLQYGLAVALLLILGLIGYGLWYLSDAAAKDAAAKQNKEKVDRDAREEADKKLRETNEQKEKDALLEKQKREKLEGEVRAGVKDVEFALAGVPTAGDDPVRWDDLLGRAREGQDRAEKLLAAIKEPTLGPVVGASRQRLTAAQQDRQLVTWLDDVAFGLLERDDVAGRNQTTARRYQQVFMVAQVAELDAGKFADRVKAHPVPAALIEAVFDWHANASDVDRKVLAPVLDRVTAGTPFLADWWAADKDPTPAGTRKLLELAGGKDADTQSGWVTHRVFCDLWARGERDAALRAIRGGLGRHPEDYRLNARLALSLPALDTSAARAAAVRYATAAVALRPRSVNACVLLARVLGADDPPAALQYLDRLIELDKGNVVARTERAAVYERLNRPDKAAEDYKAMDDADQSVAARLGLVRTRWAGGETKQAVDDLRKLIPKVPRTADAQLRLAETCAALYLEAEATTAYREAIKAAPNDPNPRLRFAAHLEKVADALPPGERGKKLWEVEAELRQAADDIPANFLPYWHLVFVYNRLGDGPKALIAGRKAAELSKGDPNAEWILGYALMVAAKLHPTDAALAAPGGGLAAAQLSADRAETAAAVGALTGGEGCAGATDSRYAAAAAAATAYVTKYQDARGYHLIAEVAAAQSRWGEAAGYAEKAARLTEDPHYWNQVGIYRGYNLDRTGAVAALEHALELAPNDAWIHWNLSGWYFSLFEVGKGLEHQMKAWDLNPALKGRQAEPPKPSK